MSEAEELNLLDTLAKKYSYPDWKEYMRNHTAVFYPVGVNTLVHSFATISVEAVSLARKEERNYFEKKFSEPIKDKFLKQIRTDVRLETAEEIFEEFDKIIEHYKGILNFWQDETKEWKKMEYTELKSRFLSKPQSDKGEKG